MAIEPATAPIRPSALSQVELLNQQIAAMRRQLAALEEALAAFIPGYQCCTFRGSIVALDTATGRILWKTYTLPNIPGFSGSSPPSLARKAVGNAAVATNIGSLEPGCCGTSPGSDGISLTLSMRAAKRPKRSCG